MKRPKNFVEKIDTSPTLSLLDGRIYDLAWPNEGGVWIVRRSGSTNAVRVNLYWDTGEWSVSVAKHNDGNNFHTKYEKQLLSPHTVRSFTAFKKFIRYIIEKYVNDF